MVGKEGKGLLEEKGGGLADGGIEKAPILLPCCVFWAVSTKRKETSTQGES